MKNLFLLSTLLTLASLNGTVHAQCTAPLTITATANPGEVEFEYDLIGVTNPTDFVGIISIFNTTTQTDYGFVYITQNSNPLTYQFPANGTYDLASETMDSLTTCTDSAMYSYTVSNMPITNCTAPLTITATANPGEVIFEYDLNGVTNPADFVGIISIFNTTTQTDYGFVSITQNSNPLTYQFPANGTYDLASETMDSLTTCSNSTMYNYTVGNVSTACTAAFTIVNDSVITTQYYGFNNSTGTNLSYLWNFGDGGTSTDQYPTHTFASVGTFNVCLTVDDGNFCNDTICQTITVSTKASQTTINIYDPAFAGLEVQTNFNEISVYPNPTNGNFTISFQAREAQNSTITVMDLNGRIIASQIVENTSGYNQVDFDLEGIAPGVYFWNLNNIANGKVLIK